jgi:hypothetical protein
MYRKKCKALTCRVLRIVPKLATYLYIKKITIKISAMVSEILAIFIEAYARNKINGINNIAIILLTRKITKR